MAEPTDFGLSTQQQKAQMSPGLLVREKKTQDNDKGAWRFQIL